MINISPIYRWTSVRLHLWWLSLLLIALAPTPVLAAAAPKTAAEQPKAEGEEREQPSPHAYKLGDFRIKNFRPVQREKVTLDLTVYVEVEEGQQARFERVWKTHEHRIRNQIITSARLVPPNSFDDPTLHALRRRIYLRLRRAVPALPMNEVFISDFSYLLE